jgi:hypothetical protein
MLRLLFAQLNGVYCLRFYFASWIGPAGVWIDNKSQIWRILYFVLSFCLAIRRCMNLDPSFL